MLLCRFINNCWCNRIDNINARRAKINDQLKSIEKISNAYEREQKRQEAIKKYFAGEASLSSIVNFMSYILDKPLDEYYEDIHPFNPREDFWVNFCI